MRPGNLGQVGPIPVITAGVEAGLNIYHMKKLMDMQNKFQRELHRQDVAIEFVKLLVDRFSSVAERLAVTGNQPGTERFEKLLAAAMRQDMRYLGNCQTVIYGPSGNEAWATVRQNGALEQPSNLPREIGVIWATGCRNAQDRARAAWVKNLKSQSRFDIFKTSKFDLGTLDLFLRFGAGLFVVLAMIIVLKIQSAIIKEQ